MDDRNEVGTESSNDAGVSNYDGNAATTRIGLDVGTSKVVTARGDSKKSDSAAQLNAFLAVPYTSLAQNTLQQNSIPYYREGDELIVYGSASENFAHMFNAESRRPMAKGILNSREPAAAHVLESILSTLVPPARQSGEVIAFSVPAAAHVLESILSTLVPPARQSGEVIAFSVPAASVETGADITYHEETLKRYLKGRGYTPLAVNEGLAVVLAELANESFTGIGISCGGGMCNVALSYLSIPSLAFSIAQGGDFIDSAVGSVVHESATRVKAIKEDNLDLTRSTDDKIKKALHIYYDKLIESLVDELHRAVARSQKLPRTNKPLPIVLAGGTAMPTGFRERFEQTLRKRTLPFEVGEVRLASDPLTATARGALVAALAER